MMDQLKLLLEENMTLTSEQQGVLLTKFPALSRDQQLSVLQALHNERNMLLANYQEMSQLDSM